MVKKPTTASKAAQAALPEQGSGQSVVEKLVTFQSEREFDVFSGQIEERLFLKLYVAARTSGLLAEISDRDWKTLCVLATYMNAEGFCHPSQAELARSLGCSRQMANERVNHLAQFRFRGKPVLLIVKDDRSERGTWTKNRYRVLPLSQLSIFNGDASRDTVPETADDDATPDEDKGTATVSRKLDTDPSDAPTVSSRTVTVALDTNKKQLRNQNVNTSNIRKGHIPLDDQAPTGIGDGLSSSTMSDSAIRSSEQVRLEQEGTSENSTYDEVRGVIVAYLQDFARELNDQAPLSSSVTRAYRLYQRAGTDLDTFIAAMYAARSRTQERSASIRSTGPGSGKPGKAKMAFWFACLVSELGLFEKT